MRSEGIWHYLPAWTGLPDVTSYLATLFGGISSFFRPNAAAFLGPHLRLGAERAGFYSTAPLRKTVSELVDFSLINRSSLRVTVGASEVRTGVMRYFDSRDQAITIDHILASSALPPAFPAVRVDREFYWDGGILSNSPTEVLTGFVAWLVWCVAHVYFLIGFRNRLSVAMNCCGAT